MRPGGAPSDRRRGRLEQVRYNEPRPSFRNTRPPRPSLATPSWPNYRWESRQRPSRSALSSARFAPEYPRSAALRRNGAAPEKVRSAKPRASRRRCPGWNRDAGPWRGRFHHHPTGRVCGARRRRAARRHIRAVAAITGRNPNSAGAGRLGFKRLDERPWAVSSPLSAAGGLFRNDAISSRRMAGHPLEAEPISASWSRSPASTKRS